MRQPTVRAVSARTSDAASVSAPVITCSEAITGCLPLQTVYAPNKICAGTTITSSVASWRSGWRESKRSNRIKSAMTAIATAIPPTRCAKFTMTGNELTGGKIGPGKVEIANPACRWRISAPKRICA